MFSDNSKTEKSSLSKKIHSISDCQYINQIENNK